MMNATFIERDHKSLLGVKTLAQLTGSEILAKALKNEGVEDLFFLMGGPMLLAEVVLY